MCFRVRVVLHCHRFFRPPKGSGNKVGSSAIPLGTCSLRRCYLVAKDLNPEVPHWVQQHTQAAAAQSHGHMLSAALRPPLRGVREAHFALVAVAHEVCFPIGHLLYAAVLPCRKESEPRGASLGSARSMDVPAELTKTSSKN